MKAPILNTLLKEYEQKKYIAELNFEKEKQNFYSSNPELAKLNDELSKKALAISKAILNNDMSLAGNLKDEFNMLKNKKEKYISSLDIPKRSKRTSV